MHTVLTLLKPRLIGGKNRLSKTPNNRGLWRASLLCVLGAAFSAGGFMVSRRVLDYFKGIEDIGPLLAAKLLSMVLVTLFALLLFSAILQSLSKFYLSRDLLLVHAVPAPGWKIFLSRWIEVVFDSSWMMIAFSLPYLIAYGVVFRAGPLYYMVLGIVLAGLSIIAATLASFLTLTAVMVIPANRMRNIFVLLGVLLFIAVYVAVRMLKPEQLVDPEIFETVMVYVATLETPASPLLPTTWAADALKAAIRISPGDTLVSVGLIWSFAGFGLCMMLIVADRLYGSGVSRTQTAGRRFLRTKRRHGKLILPFPSDIRALAGKEIKTFFRDASQWSQLFLIGALVLIYVYNFKVLPLDKSPIQTVYLQNLLGFLNMGLALFVLTAVSARFAFPAVSSEREAFWLIQSAPMLLRRYLWVKFFFFFIPLLTLTEILVVVTNLLLQVSAFMMWLSIFSVLAMVPGVVALGIGFGAAFADFKAENPAQTLTGFGGVLYMIVCAVFIGVVIVVEAGPVYSIFLADMKGETLTSGQVAWTVGCFLFCAALCSLALLLPMAFGVQSLNRRQI